MITLVKFIRNPLEAASANSIITKTLGKTGVIDRSYPPDAKQPKEEEFWYVELARERGAGSARGLFVLRPIQKIGVAPNSTNNDPDIVHLIPGGFDSVKQGNVILVYPKKLYQDKLGPNWICSIEMKKNLMAKHREGNDYKVNSVIIVYDGSSDWEKEELMADKNKRKASGKPDNTRPKVFKGKHIKKDPGRLTSDVVEELDPKQTKLPY